MEERENKTRIVSFNIKCGIDIVDLLVYAKWHLAKDTVAKERLGEKLYGLFSDYVCDILDGHEASWKEIESNGLNPMEIKKRLSGVFGSYVRYRTLKTFSLPPTERELKYFDRREDPTKALRPLS